MIAPNDPVGAIVDEWWDISTTGTIILKGGLIAFNRAYMKFKVTLNDGQEIVFDTAGSNQDVQLISWGNRQPANGGYRETLSFRMDRDADVPCQECNGTGICKEHPVPDQLKNVLFTFAVSLKDRDGAPLTVTATRNGEEITLTDGDTVALKANETLVLHRLPYGAVYSITEKDVPEGWEQTASAFTSGTIRGTVQSAYVGNRYRTPPPEPPRKHSFSFTKRWQGGRENGIDWVLYTSDGQVAHKKFTQKTVGENTWSYIAYFDSDEDFYIIETPLPGYATRYENVGRHAQVTDRCYNGGTIVNVKVPQTGDSHRPGLFIAMALAAIPPGRGAPGARSKINARHPGAVGRFAPGEFCLTFAGRDGIMNPGEVNGIEDHRIDPFPG